MSQILENAIAEGDPAELMAEAIIDKPAVLFAGQGSQEKGMGRDIAEKNKDAMNLWKTAERASGLPLREIYWDGDEQAMNDTRALQPAMTVVNLNLWNMLTSQTGLAPRAVAGHSLGEFSALVAARAISPESALEITSLRGRLMAEADPEGKGAMAAIVKLEEQQVLDIVERAAAETGELLVAANYNTPVQLVVSGTKNAVQRACSLAREMKGRGVELKVSGAFHSPMMAEANRELTPLLEKTEWKDPAIPIYCNADAAPAVTAQKVKHNILRQMISPVFWKNLIRSLYLAGIRWWMEISPRAVLGKMVGPSLAGIAGQCDSLRIDLINSLSSVMNYAL